MTSLNACRSAQVRNASELLTHISCSAPGHSSARKCGSALESCQVHSSARPYEAYMALLKTLTKACNQQSSATFGRPRRASALKRRLLTPVATPYWGLPGTISWTGEASVSRRPKLLERRTLLLGGLIVQSAAPETERLIHLDRHFR